MTHISVLQLLRETRATPPSYCIKTRTVTERDQIVSFSGKFNITLFDKIITMKDLRFCLFVICFAISLYLEKLVLHIVFPVH